MARLGAHLSIAGGMNRAVERARLVGAECLQLFLKSPSQWRFAPLGDDEVHRFREAAQQAALTPIVGHVSYLVNLASPDDALFEKSCRCLLEEWDRADRLGLNALVLHAGAHMASGERAGLDRVASALKWLRSRRPDRRLRILLETTAGAGTTLCGRFEHLTHLVAACDPDDRWLGVCIDTCHLWAAGYDLRTPAALDDTLCRLDVAVGLDRLAVVHANDARGQCGGHLDRHEHIGRGRLGLQTFRLMLAHPALRRLPFIIETPKHDAHGRKMDPVNLRALRRLAAAVEP